MKKLYLFLIATIITLLLGVNLASASLCKSADGYYEECSDKPLFNYRYQGPSDRSSASYYKTDYKSNNYGDSNRDYNYYNNYNYNSNNMPIFKGSYGNYRYQMYLNGDYTPNKFFVDYPDYGYPAYFGGGYYNYGYPYSSSYYGYGRYPFYSGGFGYGGLGYGYNSYGYNNRYSGYPYDSIYYSMPFFYGWF